MCVALSVVGVSFLGLFSLTNTVCFSSLSHSVAEKALYNTYYSLFVRPSSFVASLSASPTVIQHFRDRCCLYDVLASVLVQRKRTELGSSAKTVVLSTDHPV